jgi:hypothetical protein
LFCANRFGKHCAARLSHQFVELSETEGVRKGEFTSLNEKAPVVLSDYAQFWITPCKRSLGFPEVS